MKLQKKMKKFAKILSASLVITSFCQLSQDFRYR